DLKAAIRTEPPRGRRMVKPKRVGRTQGVGLEHGMTGSSVAGHTSQWPRQAQGEGQMQGQGQMKGQGQMQGMQGQTGMPGQAQGPDGRIGPAVPAAGGMAQGGVQPKSATIRAGSDGNSVGLGNTSQA